jgi:glutathione S-transferase
MAVKLHRCPLAFIKGPHPCWQVEKALQEAGVSYEVVKGPLVRGRRSELLEHTGQKLYPAIERADGTWIKRDSQELVNMIRAGELG